MEEKEKRQNQSGIVAPARSNKTYSAKNIKIIIAICVFILPFLIIIASKNATSGLPDETKTKHSNNMSLPQASASAQNEANQTRPAFQTLPTPDSPAISSTAPDSSASPTSLAPITGGNEKTEPPYRQLEIPRDGALDQRSFPEPDKIAYITIDDGPSRAITPGILDVLKQEGIKATFFVLPHSGVDDIYQRIIDEGHEIGNHSYSHVYTTLYEPDGIDAFSEDVSLAHAFIMDNFGYVMTSFRFPGGAMSRSTEIITPRREILAGLGYRDFDWNVELGDSNPKQKDKSAEALTSNVLDKTRNRQQLIVLMHDTKSKSTTLEALPFIITGLREQGYAFDVIRNYRFEVEGQ